MRGVRIVFGLVALLGVVLGLAGWLSFASLGLARPSKVGDGGSVARHAYPSPSYWPASPYSSVASTTPIPEVTVAPCPKGEVPTTAIYQGKTIPACTVPGGVPPDRHTGPVCAGVNGGPAYPPVREPDGSYDCG